MEWPSRYVSILNLGSNPMFVIVVMSTFPTLVTSMLNKWVIKKQNQIFDCKIYYVSFTCSDDKKIKKLKRNFLIRSINKHSLEKI